MDDKRSVLLYATHWRILKKLPMEERDAVFQAIFSLIGEDDMPELSLLADVAFTPIKENIVDNLNKWEASRKQKSEAGKKSAKARASANDASNTNTVERNSTPLNTVEHNVNVNVNDNVNDNVKDNNKHIVHAVGDEPRTNADSESVAGVDKSTVGTEERVSLADKKGSRHEANEHFERLWALYPQKRGKSGVSEAKRRALLKVSVEEMARAIDRYKAEVEAASFERQWLNGSTWFNGRYADYLDATYEPPAKAHAPSRFGRYVSSEGVRDFSDMEE